jgi:hypothetical protein
MRRTRLVLLVAIAAAALLAAGGVAARWLRPRVAPPAWENDYDVTAQPPEEIAPGTVVENGPPAGWSHLVIKSLPRVKPSEVPRLPKNAIVGRDGLVRRVSWMFTAFTADVVPERQGSRTRYTLRAIGLGLGASVNGRDTVFSVESAEKLGVKLDPIQAQTLNTGYAVQRQARVVVHGPSFALLDTPVAFRCGDKNRYVRYRYGLLVDPPTGRLDVFCWRLGAEGGECSDLSRAVLLRPDTIDEAELIPDLAEFNFAGIPNEQAFGVDDLPPSRLEVVLPAGLRDLAAKTRFAADEARALEDGLRKLLPK